MALLRASVTHMAHRYTSSTLPRSVFRIGMCTRETVVPVTWWTSAMRSFTLWQRSGRSASYRKCHQQSLVCTCLRPSGGDSSGTRCEELLKSLQDTSRSTDHRIEYEYGPQRNHLGCGSSHGLVHGSPLDLSVVGTTTSIATISTTTHSTCSHRN